MEFYHKMAGLPAMIFTIAVLFICGCIYRWRNPKCRGGVLPPGSSGFPLIGETLQLIRPVASSFDLIPFFKSRILRYGPVFRTNIAGSHAIISADHEFNRFLLRRDGDLIEPCTFSQTLLGGEQEKHFRKFVLHHFGVELIREKLLGQVEVAANQTLCNWSAQESVEVKKASVTMSITLAVQQIFSGDIEASPDHICEMIWDFAEGLMSLPLNIPGTTHHKCLQMHKKVKRLIKGAVQKRVAAAAQLAEKSHRGDLLDYITKDMTANDVINEDYVVQFLFNLLFVTSESVSTTLALTMKLLHDHPAVLEELQAEHEAILKGKDKMDAPINWSDYKSMTFTHYVINEVLRLTNSTPGIFRRALKQIPINGYVIPKGWLVILATSVLHLDPNQFEDPLSFNPWRWKDIKPDVASKIFLPFGAGIRQCTGSEYGKAFMATFLHVMVTKYRFTLVKGTMVRAPLIQFPDGLHFVISEKSK